MQFTFGKTANQAWHEALNGDLLLDLPGRDGFAIIPRHPSGKFVFSHDSIEEQRRLGVVREAYTDGEGTFLAFRVGPLWFKVVGRYPAEDLYHCEPMGSAPPRPKTFFMARTA